MSSTEGHISHGLTSFLPHEVELCLHALHLLSAGMLQDYVVDLYTLLQFLSNMFILVPLFAKLTDVSEESFILSANACSFNHYLRDCTETNVSCKII